MKRGVVPHVDDLGMCHSGNRAFLDLSRRGLVTCGSVMVPCPWFSEMADAAQADPSLDLGVHLTLTSEWQHYRWRPLSTSSVSSGLIDQDGYFWRTVQELRHHMVVEAAELELRTQIERAMAAGGRSSHLDAHMAAAMAPELLPVHVSLAREFRLVPVLPRHIGFAPDPPSYDRTVAAFHAEGLPLPDECRGTLAVPSEHASDGYRSLINAIPPGITHLALHCAIAGDIEAITPTHAPWRMQEYSLFADGSIHDWCQAAGIAAFGYRAIQNLWYGTSAAADHHDRSAECMCQADSNKPL